MDSKTRTGIHDGYANGNVYRCYIPELKRVFISKDETFVEKLYKNENAASFGIRQELHNGSSNKNGASDEEVHQDVDEENNDDESGQSEDEDTNLEDPNDKGNSTNERKLIPWKSGEFARDEINREFLNEGNVIPGDVGRAFREGAIMFKIHSTWH